MESKLLQRHSIFWKLPVGAALSVEFSLFTVAFGARHKLDHRIACISGRCLHFLLGEEPRFALAGLSARSAYIYVLRPAFPANFSRSFAQSLHLDLGAAAVPGH